MCETRVVGSARLYDITLYPPNDKYVPDRAPYAKQTQTNSNHQE
jgi:hypothetical protein